MVDLIATAADTNPSEPIVVRAVLLRQPSTDRYTEHGEID
jgi:hypothetical protein